MGDRFGIRLARPPPQGPRLVTMSHNKVFFNCPALKRLDFFRLKAEPSFFIAVHCALEASSAKSCGGGTDNAFDQTLILVLAIDGADRTILFFKSDGKELALRCGNEAVNFLNLVGSHGFVFVFVFFDGGTGEVNENREDEEKSEEEDLCSDGGSGEKQEGFFEGHVVVLVGVEETLRYLMRFVNLISEKRRSLNSSLRLVLELLLKKVGSFLTINRNARAIFAI